jgi:hypothetical protein
LLSEFTLLPFSVVLTTRIVGAQSDEKYRLGELVMIHKAVMREEEESLTSQSTHSSADMSSDMESLSLTPGSSAMSAVFGRASSDGSSGNSLLTGPSSPSLKPSSSSRTSSPSRSSSGGGGFFHHKRRSSSQGSVDRAKQTRNDHLARWLTSGNVIYKSVGLGLMDLIVGLDIIKIATEKGLGSHIENFS